jgi:hypothetical protein
MAATLRAALLVAAVVILQTAVMGRAIVLLDVALAVAWIVWSMCHEWRAKKGLLPLYAVGLLVFAAHFAEEYATGFYRQFPAFAGYEWPAALFLAFNAGWFLVMVVAGIAAQRGQSFGFLFILFFAIGGGVLNGVGHILIAAILGRYFPGLVTAPLLLVIGVALLRRLASTID